MTPTNLHGPIKIIGICGSLSANGATRQALKVALDGAAEFGAEVTLLELRDLDLVIFGSVAASEYPADVVTLHNKRFSSTTS